MGPLGLFVALWATPAAAVECDSPTTATDLGDASREFYSAWKQLDAEGVSAAMAEADRALLCIDEPLAAPDVVTYFQLQGLSAFLREDKTAARDAFRAALGVLPDYSLPSTVAAAGDDWYEMYEALRSVPDDQRTSLPTPEHGWVQVDGAKADERPAGRPWLFQQFDASGKVVQTVVVATGEDPPEYAVVAPAPEPELPEAPPPKTSKALLTGAIVSGAVGVAGLGGATMLKWRYDAIPEPQEADKLIGPNIALGTLGWAGVATGAGLATGAVVVGRW